MIKITPIYSYHLSEIPLPDDGALFHYTKYESFLKILESLTLRTSPLCRMNDLNEANIGSLNWNNDFMLMYNVQNYVREQCSILSFSRNYKIEGLGIEGSNHPAMWAHYADNSNGVCIVLDKEAFIANNESLLKDYFFRIDTLHYTIRCAPEQGIEENGYSTPSEFVRNNYRELFFKKHIDWQYEDEERFFVESPELFLNIKGAIRHIVLGAKLAKDKKHLQQILQLVIDKQSKCYRYFNKHSFAMALPNIDGYITLDASMHIDSVLKSMASFDNDAKEYLAWHKKEFHSQ